ncbi:MAG: hypothetical protein IKD47_01005 [Clostridia bacterium]|nr:hypothetical protein [Clostridia bacterium]
MNAKKEQNPTKINYAKRASKECAYLAVFVALLIAVQLCLSLVPGVELVTVLFVAYAFVFGVKRSVIAAIAFSLLRQLVFGFFPTVLVLYLVYFPLLAITFGALGKKLRLSLRALIVLTVIACGCSACFTLLDNVITPLWYGYSARAAEIYFYASFSVMLPQVICAAVSVFFLFLPLQKAFSLVKRGLQ